MIRQVLMYSDLSAKINTHETSHGAQCLWTYFVCVCFHVCGRRIPPLGGPWLTTPLHGTVQEFWDLLSISVVVAHQKGILLQCFSSYGWKSTDKKYIFQFWDDIL